MAVGEISGCLISSAQAKTAKAGSKVNKNHTKLAEATKGAAILTPPGHGTALAVFIFSHSHPHKKCRGTTGSPSSVHPPVVALSCPRSKRRLLQIRSSGDNNKMLVGKDTNDRVESPVAGLAKHRNSLPQGTRSEAHGGCRYGSLLAHGCPGPKPADQLVTGQALALQKCEFIPFHLPMAPGQTMTPMLRGVQMRLPLAMKTVTRDMLLLPLVVPLPYSTTTGSQFLVRGKGTQPLSLTGLGRDLKHHLTHPLCHVPLCSRLE